jgi:hypothetical protein
MTVEYFLALQREGGGDVPATSVGCGDHLSVSQGLHAIDLLQDLVACPPPRTLLDVGTKVTGGGRVRRVKVATPLMVAACRHAAELDVLPAVFNMDSRRVEKSVDRCCPGPREPL